MRFKVEVEMEFDPAKSAEIVKEARRLFFERTSEHSIRDDEGTSRDALPEEVGPDDAIAAVIEMLHCAVEDFALCERLSIAIHGTVCDAPRSEVPIN